MKKGESKAIMPSEHIEGVIYIIRGFKVILGHDLATLYGVETKQFNRAVNRNIDRFPEDFAFRLTDEEWKSLRCQIGTSKKGRGGRRYPPLVFTEHGVAMAANILRSKQAALISIEIVRAFVRLRQTLSIQKEMAKELMDLKTFVLKHSHANDREFKRIWQALDKLSNPPFKEPRKIGFDTG